MDCFRLISPFTLSPMLKAAVAFVFIAIAGAITIGVTADLSSAGSAQGGTAASVYDSIPFILAVTVVGFLVAGSIIAVFVSLIRR